MAHILHTDTPCSDSFCYISRPMDLATEIASLRKHLDQLSRDFDRDLTTRFALRRPPIPRGIYWKMRWLAGRLLYFLERIGIIRRGKWPAALKHATKPNNARPLLIWAIGTDRETLREACQGFRVLDTLPEFAPVLVTDTADFTFYSRLGWMVEYVPAIAGKGEAYDLRKARYLAWLYQGAPALPVGAYLKFEPHQDEFRRWISARG